MDLARLFTYYVVCCTFQVVTNHEDKSGADGRNGGGIGTDADAWGGEDEIKFPHGEDVIKNDR